VPAFAGLFAPHWDATARGCMVGMTAFNTSDHVTRAALEAAAYQAKEVIEAMAKDR
jgi:glycerol kinase